MIIVNIDLLDGREMKVVVQDAVAAARLHRFVAEADVAFADKERWDKMRKLMTHERAGPHVGWTLGIVLPGDDPDDAIDSYIEKAES